MEQYPKSEVGFEHPAQGSKHCSQCKHFEVLHRNGCERVKGIIRPGDFCKRFFDPKSHMADAFGKARK